MECKETICTRCIHKNVCEYMSSYCNLLEQIDDLDIHDPSGYQDIATKGVD